ncbi:MAG: phosphoribosyltransferase family protein [Pseudomonadota bacterium]
MAHVDRPVLIGPDSESEQWVASVARLAGAPYVIGSKVRTGDRGVEVTLPSLAAHQGRRPVILDDVVSSGVTLLSAAKALARAGFAKPIGLAVHGLQNDEDQDRILTATEALVTTDSIPNPCARISLDAMIATAIAGHLGL